MATSDSAPRTIVPLDRVYTTTITEWQIRMVEYLTHELEYATHVKENGYRVDIADKFAMPETWFQELLGLVAQLHALHAAEVS